ncbi:hypothetical protein BKA70DRAFT_1269225 [Coprinopsis sp. MPI-PUGE-AT-0042]|nr:hypothetical protein BKA70DRAFT_1318565 [Coprinopsis sp. MPI-PUGE-AT-0042]KAH6911021.1 hypothetical protein BKA70DRAFT_1269225 [Coprinopsis sp. MPI-PUGE-AT-0042]
MASYAAIQENNRNYLSIESAMATFILLEFFQTLPDEVALVWPDKWSLLKGLYMLNRYGALIGTVFSLMFEVGTKNSTFTLCKAGYYFQGAVLILNLAWSETILFMRVYALSRQNRYVGIFLAVTWTGIFAALVVNFLRGAFIFVFVDHPLPGYACLPTPIASKLLRTLPYFLILSEQILVICMCIYFRLGEFAGSKSRLARTFSRDGLYYFFAISLMSIANVSFSMAFLNKYDHYLGPPQGVVMSVLATRLVLHLRKVKADGDTSNSAGFQAQTPVVRLREMKSPKSPESALKSFIP